MIRLFLRTRIRRIRRVRSRIRAYRRTPKGGRPSRRSGFKFADRDILRRTISSNRILRAKKISRAHLSCRLRRPPKIPFPNFGTGLPANVKNIGLRACDGIKNIFLLMKRMIVKTALRGIFADLKIPRRKRGISGLRIILRQPCRDGK